MSTVTRSHNTKRNLENQVLHELRRAMDEKDPDIAQAIAEGIIELLRVAFIK